MLKSCNHKHISTSFMISSTSFYCLEIEINFSIKWGKWIGSSKNCSLDHYMLYHIVVSTTNNNNYCTFLQFSFRTLCQATKRQFSNFWFRIWCIFFLFIESCKYTIELVQNTKPFGIHSMPWFIKEFSKMAINISLCGFLKLTFLNYHF